MRRLDLSSSVLRAGLRQGPASQARVWSRHASSSSSATHQASSASKNNGWQVWLAGAAGTGGFTFSLLGLNVHNNSSGYNGSDKPSALPIVDSAASSSSKDSPIHWQSPAPALTLEEASARLREGQGTLSFDAGDGCTGRFDYVRYASNSPVEDDYSFGNAPGPGGRAGWCYYWGIYDGHAGWATSTVLREALIPYTSAHLSSLSAGADSRKVNGAIKKAFLALDDNLSEKASAAVKSGNSNNVSGVISALAPFVAGSCALLSIFDPINSILRVACVGDSRAVLGTYSIEQGKYTSLPMSKDQTGFNADEVDRLSAAHPGEKDDILDPKSGRLLGIAVTRAFGDHRWKWTEDLVRTAQERYFGSSPRPKSKTPPYMTAEPVVQETKIVRAGGSSQSSSSSSRASGQQQQGDFLIMASDGLWDHISSEDAVICVEQWIQARRSSGGQIPLLGQIKDTTKTTEPDFELESGNFATWKVKPEQFVCEEDNAATHLVKNAFGGSKRRLFKTVMSAYYPLSRNVRDDVTVNVIFFGGVQ